MLDEQSTIHELDLVFGDAWKKPEYKDFINDKIDTTGRYEEDLGFMLADYVDTIPMNDWNFDHFKNWCLGGEA